MKHLASLNPFFWKYRYRFSLGIIFILLTNYFRILAPQLTGYIVNLVVKSTSLSSSKSSSSINKFEYDFLVQWIISTLDLQSINNKVAWCSLLLLVIALISGFFMFLMRQTIIVMSRLIEYSQKNQVFNHYQQLDSNFYKTHSTGDLMSRISEDVSRVRMYTGPAIMYFINLAAILIFSIYFMFQASPKLTLISLSPLPILAITIYFVNIIINKKSERIQALLSDLTTNAQESYSGIRVIKSFVQEKAMLSFFSNNSKLYKNNALALAKTEAIYFPSIGLLIGLSTLITIMAGGMDVINGVPGTSIGTIAEFVLYIQMLTFPVSAIGWTASMTQRAAASQKRINEFLQTSPSIQQPAALLKPSINSIIQLQSIDFTYSHTGINAIKDFSLDINKGEKIAIVGRTGSGKSTIAQLLLRMYDAQNGLLLYDGVPINKIDLHWLRAQISYVPQDVFLFSETVQNNIAFGVDEASLEQVINAAKIAGIHNEIEGFSDGYQTMIGERGVTLSGGQKQRISIARALLKNPSMVIFDDCLSAVDAKTEKEILNNLNIWWKNKTAIIITHRIFSLLHFDKIIVLEEGEIIEMGNHAELLQQNGFYAQMYARQQQQEGDRPSN
ncbi:MAG: ABC transporter ATP-binding protein [Chitinophagia bacterium]|nr:ABC transporter ATP-binding protein [Chitinophagia bacterium]